MIEGQEGVAWDDWLALADATERLGFDGLFTSDHYGAPLDSEPRDALDVWAVLAALGPRTSRIRLGTMVSPATFRPPTVLAKLALTADHTSGGRVEVGMGAGWHEREHAAFGFPFPPLGERLAMLEEQVAILRALFDAGEIDHHGAHYELDHCVLRPRPLQAAPPDHPRRQREAARRERWRRRSRTSTTSSSRPRTRRGRPSNAWTTRARPSAATRAR